MINPKKRKPEQNDYSIQQSRSQAIKSQITLPLLAPLYREADDDEDEYTFHLCALREALEDAKYKKLSAAYAAEEERTKELTEIQRRLDFITGYLHNEHDGFPCNSPTYNALTEDHKPPKNLRPKKGSRAETETIYKYFNEYSRSNAKALSYSDLFHYMAQGKDDVKLCERDVLKFRGGEEITKDNFRRRYKQYFGHLTD